MLCNSCGRFTCNVPEGRPYLIFSLVIFQDIKHHITQLVIRIINNIDIDGVETSLVGGGQKCDLKGAWHSHTKSDKIPLFALEVGTEQKECDHFSDREFNVRFDYCPHFYSTA